VAMTPKKPDINTVAFLARDMPPDERQAFVRKQCHDDVTQISKVYELLKTALHAPETAEFGATPDNAESEWDPGALIGTRLGVYELTRLLGTGGMGAVFLAQRIDAEFQQQVAIKLVRNTLLSANITARLRAERQILASLQHPNIATLMDGGTAADGTPYLVMEYIDGMPIDTYCDREKLTVDQRLRMFLKVCSAVQCAHQNLIVHRDLKPTNILVNREGQPKLLDFGIAKLLDTHVHQRHANLTQHDMRMLTPAHASPEQILGDPITTSSDIYVLGVLLYELLCGCRPFVFPANYRLIDLEHIVCASKPAPPSAMVSRVDRESSGFMQDLARCRNTTVTRLKRSLRGDLDNIVMMAMRREPARRYSSVEQLSNDVKHWLDGLPVIATRDSFRYRAGKFTRRYALPLAGVGIAFAASVAFIIVLLVQSRHIARQRDAVELERNRAEQVSAFLLDLFRYADPEKARNNDLKARDLLDAGVKRIDDALGSQPALRATMLDTMGQVYSSLGIDNEASAALEKSLNLRLAQSGEERLDVADVLVHLALVRISQSDNTQAITLAKRALNIQKKLLGDDAVELAKPLRVMSEAATNLGNFSDAEEYIYHALSLLDSHHQFNTVEKGNALAILALLKNYEYQEAESESLYRYSLATLIPILGNDEPLVVQLRSEYASALESLGKFSEAQPILLESLTKKREMLGPTHVETINAVERYGLFMTRKGDYASAQALLDDTLKTKIKLYGEQHINVAYTRVNLAILEFMRGNYTIADKQVRTALAIYSQSMQDDNVYVAAANMVLARVLVRLHRPDEAVTIQQRVRDVFISVYGVDNPFTHRATAVLGIALADAKRIEEARPLLLAVRPYIERMTDRQEFLREYEDALAVVKR